LENIDKQHGKPAAKAGFLVLLRDAYFYIHKRTEIVLQYFQIGFQDSRIQGVEGGKSH
jgi:hypothetical protein